LGRKKHSIQRVPASVFKNVKLSMN
jgi:hypothetical protein